MRTQLRVHDSLLQICTTYPPSTHIYSVHILCLIQINLKSKTISKDNWFNYKSRLQSNDFWCRALKIARMCNSLVDDRRKWTSNNPFFEQFNSCIVLNG